MAKASLQFADYKKAVQQISRKLGGAKAQKILQDMDHSERVTSKTLKIWSPINCGFQNFLSPITTPSIRIV